MYWIETLTAVSLQDWKKQGEKQPYGLLGSGRTGVQGLE
jgi:hypothetical protein